MGRQGGEAGGICEFSVLPTQFFYGPKSAVKIKSIKNKTLKVHREMHVGSSYH